jgi:hypothetical protein
VASFFVCRVDAEIAKRLKAIGTAESEAMLGEAANANARLTYQAYEKTFAGERWEALKMPEPIRSARCGHPPESRTPPTTTHNTLSNWWRAGWRTPHRRQPSMLSPTTATSAATPSRHLAQASSVFSSPRRHWASTSTTSSRSWKPTASEVRAGVERVARMGAH